MTVALALMVNVQVLVLFPLLEHAPDHTTSRPLVALRVIVVPVANDAEPLLPTVTLMPTGLEVTRSPLRPVDVTVRVAVGAGGATANVADRVRPAAVAVMVTSVDVVSGLVETTNVALVAP